MNQGRMVNSVLRSFREKPYLEKNRRNANTCRWLKSLSDDEQKKKFKETHSF